ncbi:unnamed protein product [Lymnaea stagnalis]|uniref:EF-hand domain-containing protein n=1 Tax=Lymnaea stagnalis TaxID=6523 RepID=A0AAV2I9Z5_LYMST
MAYVFIVLLSVLAFTTSEVLDLNRLEANTFGGLDIDHDGHIERYEVNEYIKTIDGDYDGKLSDAEYVKALGLLHSTDLVQLQILRNLYNHLNFDKNSFLDDIDFDRLFTDTDSDGNGLITPLEFSRQVLTSGALSFDKVYLGIIPTFI